MIANVGKNDEKRDCKTIFFAIRAAFQHILYFVDVLIDPNSSLPCCCMKYVC